MLTIDAGCLFPSAVALMLFAGVPAAAAAPGPEGAFLFAYRAKAGLRREFDEGYRRHLEWHRVHQDPLAWYGWDVMTGPDVDLFIDGTFGPSPSEFDGRVAPAEDGADFAATAGPFADPLWRRVYRLRPDLGTSRFLEDRTPSPFVRALVFEVRPGGSDRFEPVLRRAAADARAGDASRNAAWAAYELIDGGQAPAYLLLVPAEGLAVVATGSPTAWIESLATNVEGPRASEILSDTVTRSTSAVWRLRLDLTSIP